MMDTCFPIRIRITEGEDKGKIRVVNHAELPTGVAFVVLETNAKPGSEFEEENESQRKLRNLRMQIGELRKSIWQKGYYYLSEKDSKRIDELRDSTDPKDLEIVQLILDKADFSRGCEKQIGAGY